MVGHSKEEFIKLWGPEGFAETWDGFSSEYSVSPSTPSGARDLIVDVVKQHAMPRGAALDIGCGNCEHTSRLLAPNFSVVHAVDLIPAPSKLSPKIKYHEAGDRDYTLSMIPNESIDFVWSFGCFCHLPNSAVGQYLTNVRRVLRRTGVAVILFANWDRHKLYINVPQSEREKFRENSCATWYFYDLATAQDLAQKAGFTQFVDLAPNLRDTLAELKG